MSSARASQFVIDNSVVCGWLFESQSTDYSRRVATLLRTRSAVAPALLRLEYANVLRTACRRGHFVAQQAQAALRELARLPIDIDASPVDGAALLALALRFDLTAYDAAYLDLALRRQLPIATQDGALAAAALAAGVGVV